MSDELRAAAQTIIESCDPAKPRYEPTWFVEAAEKVARAYLAEHRADDEETVSEDWLRAVGWRIDQDCAAIRLPLTSVDVLLWIETGTAFVRANGKISFRISGNNTTRGHVRRLAAALGITLREAVP